MKNFITIMAITLSIISSCSIYEYAEKEVIEVESKSIDATRIVTYNVKHCMGTDGNIDYDRTAWVIECFDADIVALQELDSVNTTFYGLVDGQELADRLDLHFTFGSAILRNDGEYGVGLLSKEVPLHYSNFALPGTEELRTLLFVEFQEYYVAVTHLSLTAADRLESIEIISEMAAQYSDKPIFLCGDFNATPSSETIQLLMNDFTILSDTTAYTFSSEDPSKTIDYISAYKDDYNYTITSRGVIYGVTASDHLPMYVDVIVSE